MASYVQNVLIVDGDCIPAVCQFVRQGERVFDFHAIHPLPSEGMTPEGKIKYWGTKGNAINAVFHEKYGTFSFQTLNAAPVPVVERLAERFPDCTFIFRWADEGGGNCGEIRYEYGHESYAFYPGDGTTEQEELYQQCWGQPMYRKGENTSCKN